MNVCFISSNGINYILYWRLFWLDGPKILCKLLERGKKNEGKLPYTYFWVVALFPRSPTTLFGLCVQVISLDPLHIFQFGFQLDFYHTTMWFCTAQNENAALQFHLFWAPVLNKHILILEKINICSREFYVGVRNGLEQISCNSIITEVGSLRVTNCSFPVSLCLALQKGNCCLLHYD